MITREDKKIFQNDLFDAINKIKDQFRNIEKPKTLYGRLSILLHNLANLITDIDDNHNAVSDIYPLLINICAECQYFCEQTEMCEQHQNEGNKQIERVKQLEEHYQKFLDSIKAYPIRISKDGPQKILYELDPALLNSLPHHFGN